MGKNNKNGEKCKQVKGGLFLGNFSIFDLKEISTVTNFLAKGLVIYDLHARISNENVPPHQDVITFKSFAKWKGCEL